MIRTSFRQGKERVPEQNNSVCRPPKTKTETNQVHVYDRKTRISKRWKKWGRRIYVEGERERKKRGDPAEEDVGRSPPSLLQTSTPRGGPIPARESPAGHRSLPFTKAEEPTRNGEMHDVGYAELRCSLREGALDTESEHLQH